MKEAVKQETTLKEATINTTQPKDKDATPRMPHERDESNDSQVSGPREVMRQAHDDIEKGLIDTDCRTQSGAGNGEDGQSSVCPVPAKKSGDR